MNEVNISTHIGMVNLQRDIAFLCVFLLTIPSREWFRWLWWQVLVKRNGCILLYCKGADSTVYPCLHSTCQALMDQTAEHMNVRFLTLCVW